MIIILGGGISGLLLGLGLARRGIASTIIERKSLQELEKPYDPRTTALNIPSHKCMDDCGAWTVLEPFVTPIHNIFVCNNMSDDMCHLFDFDGQKHEPIGYMIQNGPLRRELFFAAQKSDLITIRHGVSYEDISLNDYGVSVNLSDGSVESGELCVVADGKFSNARNMYMKSNRCEKDYHQSAIVFDIYHEKEHCNTAIEHFLPTGPFAVLPLHDVENRDSMNHRSAIVWTLPTDYAESWRWAPYDDICEHISPFIGQQLGKIEIATKPDAFPLKAFVSKDYVYKRMVMISDSAHVVHPLAGQGLNVGIGDIAELTQVISECYALGLPVSDKKLQLYQKHRKKDAISMFMMTSAINTLFSNNIGMLQFCLTKGLGIVNHFDSLKKRIVEHANK